VLTGAHAVAGDVQAHRQILLRKYIHRHPIARHAPPGGNGHSCRLVERDWSIRTGCNCCALNPMSDEGFPDDQRRGSKRVVDPNAHSLTRNGHPCDHPHRRVRHRIGAESALRRAPRGDPSLRCGAACCAALPESRSRLRPTTTPARTSAFLMRGVYRQIGSGLVSSF
jgi:hypothetical protein